MLNIAALLSLSALKPKTQATPAAPSLPSSHPAPRSDFESRLELLASQVSSLCLSELFTARLAAPQVMVNFSLLSRSQSGSARVRRPLPSSCRDCWSPPGVAGSGRLDREPDAPGSLPYGQAQLGWPWLGFAVRLLFAGSSSASTGPWWGFLFQPLSALLRALALPAASW